MTDDLPDLLVTGTDTAVGKTVVAAALALARRSQGRRVVAYKPVESGVGDGAPSDAAILAAASGASEILAEPVLQLAEPLAPAVAADRAGISIETDAMEQRIRAMRDKGWSLIVEGAGGLLVPLAWGYTALDLAERAGLAAIVVARPGLGTLNHTQLTVDALVRRGVPVRAIVVNMRGDSPDLAESTNPAALERMAPGIPIVLVPRHPTRDALEAARRTASLLGDL
jgi:dethiobiotin synthetase